MQTPERSLVRRLDHRVVAGVAGGLADHTGTGAIWWRLAFALMTLVGGLGVLMYLLLWWLVRRADLPQSAGQRFAAHFPDAPAWLGIGLLMFGSVLLAGQLGLWTPNVGWAFLLIGLGVVLYRREAERRGAGSEAVAAAGVASAPSGEPPAWGEGSSESMEVASSFDPAGPLRMSRPPRPPRERSWLGWLAFGVALVAGGALWLLRDSDIAHPSLVQLVALPLAILGAGLLVGSFAGRARWTILPGLALLPIVLLASVITVPLSGSWDNRYVTPRTADQLRPAYEQSGGNLVFDLTQLGPEERPGPVHATMAIGEIQVLLPKGIPASITGRAGLGIVEMSANVQTGLGVSQTLGRPGPDPIRMDLEVGIGDVRVLSQAPPRKHRERGGDR